MTHREPGAEEWREAVERVVSHCNQNAQLARDTDCPREAAAWEKSATIAWWVQSEARRIAGERAGYHSQPASPRDED